MRTKNKTLYFVEVSALSAMFVCEEYEQDGALFRMHNAKSITTTEWVNMSGVERATWAKGKAQYSQLVVQVANIAIISTVEVDCG
jgi:hypothetical protein